MIRRIVDSVNLMVDAESDGQVITLGCESDEPVTSRWLHNDCVPLSDTSQTKLQGVEPSVEPQDRSSSSSFSPTSLAHNFLQSSDFFAPSSWEGSLSNATSCYVPSISIGQQPVPQPRSYVIATEAGYNHKMPLRTKTESESDNSNSSDIEKRSTPSPGTPGFTRRQSPSPGASIHSPPLRGRQLPGEKLFEPKKQKPKVLEQQLTKFHCLPEPQRSSQPVQCKNKVNENQSTENAQLKQAAEGKAVVSSHDAASSSEVGVGGTSCQMDPLVMTVECMILPFVRNFNEVELRIPSSRLTKDHRRILKNLAAEYELLVLSATKGPVDQSTLVVRKRASLIQRQQAELERKRQREEEERARRLALEEENRLRLLREAEEKMNAAATRQSTCCQTSLEEPKPEVGTGRKKYRRLRNERRKLAKAKPPPAKPKMVDSCIQTVPEDHWLCPWCLQHIPPVAQCGHEAVCRAGFKQKQKELEAKSRLQQRNANAELRRKQRLGLNPLPKEKRKSHKVTSAMVDASGRSRSGTRLAIREKKLKHKSLTRPRSSSRTDPKRQTTAVVKLDEVHPNDLGAMARLMQRLCREPQCKQLADAGDSGSRPGGVKCPNCRHIYCDHHRPLGMHTGCPVEPEADSVAVGCSIACGMDLEEKRAALKSAIRQRREVLMERRQRQY
ncbi:hypothetical protein CLF_104564 [Clonorchis sinensis]|uniref:Uncharacterized protein n=1 Tax=Clonorchis sinensis TaxID=79923 RepID=H2KQR7_CLOSI|nr:hypothetical protein CLF_104564 [Clonorchis sinensis]